MSFWITHCIKEVLLIRVLTFYTSNALVIIVLILWWYVILIMTMNLYIHVYCWNFLNATWLLPFNWDLSKTSFKFKFGTTKPLIPKAVVWSCSVKKVFLEISQNLQESTAARDSFLTKLQALDLKKESLAQVYSCEFCEISKITFFYRTLPVAASVILILSVEYILNWKYSTYSKGNEIALR